MKSPGIRPRFFIERYAALADGADQVVSGKAVVDVTAG
jgi:hypothetical protein